MSVKISCSGDLETLAKTVLCRYVIVLVTMCALAILASPQSAQVATSKEDSVPHIIFRRFSSPIYPPLASISNIVGDVVLKVSMRTDNSVESLTPVSGDPILIQAALESAKQSQFECRGCGSSTYSQSFTYSFRISPDKADPCCCTSRPGVSATQSTAKVSQLENHIMITAPPMCMCPDKCSEAWAEAHSRFRSAKCLYLWKCGRHRIWLE
jgi:hypothetical protein